MIQIMASGVISFLVAIFFTPWLIRYFSNAGKGQEIREDGPKSHLRKRGTPTMGGLAILAGIVIAYLAVNTYGSITGTGGFTVSGIRSEEHTSELQSRGHLVCRLLLEKKKTMHND